MLLLFNRHAYVGPFRAPEQKRRSRNNFPLFVPSFSCLTLVYPIPVPSFFICRVLLCCPHSSYSVCPQRLWCLFPSNFSPRPGVKFTLQKPDWLIYLSKSQSPSTPSPMQYGLTCWPAFFLDIFTLGDGTDRLSQTSSHNYQHMLHYILKACRTQIETNTKLYYIE